MTSEEALTCLGKDVPEELRKHPAVMDLTGKVVDILVRTIEELTKGVTEGEDMDDIAITSNKVVEDLGRAIEALSKRATRA